MSKPLLMSFGRHHFQSCTKYCGSRLKQSYRSRLNGLDCPVLHGEGFQNIPSFDVEQSIINVDMMPIVYFPINGNLAFASV